MFCTKASCWKYEREWRCIHKAVGTLYGYDPKAIKAVYFGARVTEPSIAQVREILADQQHVEFVKFEMNPQAFQLDPHPLP